MDDLEKTKENIQPLRGGRNMEQLEMALTSESQLAEERSAYEEQITKYEGPDPLSVWYEYICWIEQTHPAASHKQGTGLEILLRCIAKFENDERYRQDHRFVKLCMKYIDTQSSPQELYQELYDRGIGTMCAEFYIGWAYYYDADDNFAQTEAIYRKGLDAGATPTSELEQAHRQFGFSMSQRLLHKDESSKQMFQSSLAERRQALTSLRAHRKTHVGSVRSGLAVRSYNPGIVKQEHVQNENNASSASMVVYTGPSSSVKQEPVESGSTSLLRSFVSAGRDRENIREPGPWTGAKSNKKPLFGTSHGPAFAISEDSLEAEPIPLLVDNFSRGITLEANHKRKNYPQKPFEIAACDDDKPAGFPTYDKTFLYCCGFKQDFSPEELRGFRYFKKRGIQNKMVEQYEPLWGNGAHAKIRLHPYHVREYKFPAGDDLKTEKPVDDGSLEGVQTRVKEMYAESEELSMEELRLKKWKEGKIKRYIDRKNDDDMLRVDMDETVIQSKRVSIAPPRMSMAPGALHAGPSRASIFPVQKPTSAAAMSMISEEKPNESSAAMATSPPVEQQQQDAPMAAPKYTGAIKKSDIRNTAEATTPTGELQHHQQHQDTPLATVKYTGAIKKTDLYKRRSEESPSGSKSVPKRASLDQDEPKLAAPKPKITIFVDDDDEPAEKEPNNGYYANETCSTQMFNMFVKSQSTPVGQKSAARQLEAPPARTNLLLEDEPDDLQAQQDENLAQIQQMKINEEPAEAGVPAGSSSNSSQAPKQLSTIMERTETSTMSAACSTKSSVSSPPVCDLVSPEQPEISLKPVASMNMKQAVRNLESMPLDSVFKVPDTPKVSEDPFESPEPAKPAFVSPFVIHIDSTETMANIPLIAKNALPAKLTPTAEPLEDKENNPAFQVLDEPTTTTTTSASLLRKNISHLPQREQGLNSLMSFKMTTERTNTVPLPLVFRPQAESALPPGPSSAPPVSSKADDSLFELLSKTASPKELKLKISPPKVEPVAGEKKAPTKVSHADSSFFDLADFQKTPEKKVTTTTAPKPPSPKPLIIQSVRGAINLADFPSPTRSSGNSLDDLNTEIFSLNMNSMKNSTLLPGRFAEFELPTASVPATINIVSPPTGQTLPKLIDFDISGVTETKPSKDAGFKVPMAPAFKTPSPIVIDLDDGDSDDLGKSIYIQKPTTSPEEEEGDDAGQQWEEIDEHFNPANNRYRRKEVDLDGTMQFIYAQTNVGEVDPFDPKLQEAFLEKIDFMSYIEDLPTCSLVNKVQPLAKGMLKNVRETTTFSVIKKIGEGTFGTVYSAKNMTSGEIVAMKQERPANLWEYYICLELRSRLNNDDILPGLMSVDYAIVGNNASILISPFSRYGNILDVCNVVKRVTNKNVDEFIAMIITSQILSIIDHLHSCMIIHADIKPDNFLLMAPVGLNSNIPCVQLIDFGVSIDLKLFPKGTTFTKIVTTECFTCIEMLERRPWTFQPDLYGLAGTAHVMLFGRYMEVQKDIVSWGIKTRMPRYFRKAVWDHFFGTLLNVRDCSEMPNLQALRGKILAELEENERYVRDKVAEFNKTLVANAH